ncbi:MAG TPA: hypothetical protein VEC08_01345 [Nitrososphaerales archaeon]|nr:hypothetical protein [Nitrososphaerales archaeon]
MIEAKERLKKMREKEKDPAKRKKITLEVALARVTSRNITVKMHYDTDKTIRQNVMTTKGVKLLIKQLPDLFPCD